MGKIRRSRMYRSMVENHSLDESINLYCTLKARTRTTSMTRNIYSSTTASSPARTLSSSTSLRPSSPADRPLPWGQFTDMEREYGGISKKDFSIDTHIYVRTSRYVKAGNHITKVFKTARETDKYFNDKSSWPKYDLVLIPDLPSE